MKLHVRLYSIVIVKSLALLELLPHSASLPAHALQGHAITRHLFPSFYLFSETRILKISTETLGRSLKKVHQEHIESINHGASGRRIHKGTYFSVRPGRRPLVREG